MNQEGKSRLIKGTKTFWKNMHSRCRNDYYYYENGIRVCERWRSFENFVLDMGLRPKGHSIDRINNNGDYEPGNCRWADKKTQSANKLKRGERIKREMAPEVAERYKKVRYPARIEKGLLNKVNKIRIKKRLSWPELTRKLLENYLASND